LAADDVPPAAVATPTVEHLLDRLPRKFERLAAAIRKTDAETADKLLAKLAASQKAKDASRVQLVMQLAELVETRKATEELTDIRADVAELTRLLRPHLLERQKQQRKAIEGLMTEQANIATDLAALRLLGAAEQRTLAELRKRQEKIAGGAKAAADQLEEIVADITAARLEEAESTLISRLRERVVSIHGGE
jgi:hypothetical protein